MAESATSSTASSRRRVVLMRQRGGSVEYGGVARYCYCGLLAPRWTSWRERNPGRRFYGCPNYKQGGGCGFFCWHDGEMGQRSKDVINELLDDIDRLYDENSRLRRSKDNECVGAEMDAIIEELKNGERRLGNTQVKVEAGKKKFSMAMIALLFSWFLFFCMYNS